MKTATPIFRTMLAALLITSCVGSGEAQDRESVAEVVIGLERAAMERWRQGDPSGFLEIIAEDYTYFDPSVDERVDGREAITVVYEGIRGQVSFSRFEMIEPRVQVAGDIAVLTFNFKSYGPDSAGSEVERSHWHTTEVFRLHNGNWRLISSHWSPTHPKLLQLAAGGQLTGGTTEFPSVARARPSEGIPTLVVGMERAALDRWGAGDPSGYLDIIAEEYTYFDPSLEKRIDNRQAITDYLEPIRGQVRVSRYEMLEPHVQTDGTTAVLTFNLKSYGVADDGAERLGSHWHSTEIYRHIGAEWNLISTHWSYTASWLKELAANRRSGASSR